MTKLTLHLWWESRDPWRDEDARKLARFVNGLPDFDPIYRSLRIPTKPATHSNRKPATDSDLKPAGVPI